MDSARERMDAPPDDLTEDAELLILRFDDSGSLESPGPFGEGLPRFKTSRSRDMDARRQGYTVFHGRSTLLDGV